MPSLRHQVRRVSQHRPAPGARTIYQEFPRGGCCRCSENIHGETRHTGKTPRRLPQSKQTQSDLMQAPQPPQASDQQGRLRGSRQAARSNQDARGKHRSVRKKRGQVPLCEAPYGPSRQRYLTPFFPNAQSLGDFGVTKCHLCSNAATVHLTDFVKGQKNETHLCQACAEKKQLLTKQELNLSAILQSVIGPHIGTVTDDLARLTCPECGIKYMEFKAEGRLGCPRYDVFQSALMPLLERIHRATRHAGKQPRPRPPARRLACGGRRGFAQSCVEAVDSEKLRRGRPDSRFAATKGCHG